MVGTSNQSVPEMAIEFTAAHVFPSDGPILLIIGFSLMGPLADLDGSEGATTLTRPYFLGYLWWENKSLIQKIPAWWYHIFEPNKWKNTQFSPICQWFNAVDRWPNLRALLILYIPVDWCSNSSPSLIKHSHWSLGLIRIHFMDSHQSFQELVYWKIDRNPQSICGYRV